MTDPLPPELGDLLGAREASAADRAWARFLERYSRLLLHVARTPRADYDAAMDRYRFVLEALRSEDCRRLRAYAADGRSRFTTWLVVVARRLCRDFDRQRYGRARGTTGEAGRDALAVRRRLADLVAEELDPGRIAAAGAATAEEELRRAELSAALERALAELDPEERLLLALRFEDGLPVRRIAEVLGLRSVFHVYRRLTPLLARLRRRLETLGVDDPRP